MRERKPWLRRMGAVGLALAMCLSLMPVSVFASGDTEGEAVAKIGDTEYATLKEAWNATRNMEAEEPITIEVLKDCELTETLIHQQGISSEREGTPKSIVLKSADDGHYTITRGEKLSDSMIVLSTASNAEATVTLKNITLDGGKEKNRTGDAIIGYKKQTTYPPKQEGPAQLILENGAILQNNYNTSGSGSAISTGVENATITMNEGATIQNNTIDGFGGGICISGNYTKFTMNGGTIEGNHAKGSYIYGGGVYVSGGSFEMNKGTIQENTSDNCGGGVSVVGSSGIFTMNGGTITKNVSDDYMSGHGLYTSVPAENVKLLGGSIIDNAKEGEAKQADIAGTYTSGISLGNGVEVGTIYRNRTVTNTSEKAMKIAVVEALTGSKQITIDTRNQNLEDGAVIVEKGKDLSSSLDPQRFLYLGYPGDQSLVEDETSGNLVLKTLTYTLSVTAPTFEEVTYGYEQP